MTNTTTSTSPSGNLRAEDCHLKDLLAILAVGTDPADYPHAAEVASGVPLYDEALHHVMTDDGFRLAVQVEVARALADRPGITIFRGTFEHDVLDRVSACFEQIIDQESRPVARPVTTSPPPAQPTGYGTRSRSSP